MKITLLRFCIISVCTFVVLPLVGQKPSNAHYLALVGTYTNKTDSKGVYAFDFDSSTGELAPKGLAGATPDPSWVVIHPNGKFVYAANEAGKQSSITAFSLDAKSAKMTQLNQVPAQGEDPCYLSLDRTGKFLFVANYTSGTVAVFPIATDGKLGEHTAVVKDAGTPGPNKERQEGPHAHWIEVSQDNRFVFVSDLGLDAILSYKFDASQGTLTPNDPPMAKLTSGAGPRHVAFSRSGKFIYVVSELNSTITGFSYNAAQGSLHEFQIISTLPKDFSGRNDTAEIIADPSGKWLFASNRGHDTIAAFAISPSDGTLRHIGDYPTGGHEPRHFALDPTGHFLLAENQNSNTIDVFRIDPATGALNQVSQTTNISSPVCLAFVR
jgi:6-phosphogluconolactonase